MAQQTAVKWLYHKLSTCTSDEMVGNINNWFEQAKEMEKEQIIDACFEGMNCFPFDANRGRAEQYYKETYT